MAISHQEVMDMGFSYVEAEWYRTASPETLMNHANFWEKESNAKGKEIQSKAYARAKSEMFLKLAILSEERG